VNRTATATKQQMAELRELRDDLVSNFREQMVLRHRLMEIGEEINGPQASSHGDR